MKLIVNTLLGALALLSSNSLALADWPQWRGPDRENRSPDTGLLKTWPEGGPKLVWRTDEAGLGYAGYAIVGERLYTMGLRKDKEHLLCFDAATGKELWATAAGDKYDNDWGDGPRMTPTVDSERVYGISGDGTLTCAKASNGDRVWQTSLVKDLGGKLQSWGYTEAPLIVGDLVICTPGGAKGTLAGLDKRTGDVRWRTKDVTDEAQYSSCILIEHRGKPQVVQLVMKQVFGVDPANGALLWSAPFAGRTAVIPTPLYHDGHVYVTAGYGVGCALFELGEDGRSAKAVYDNKVMKNHHGGVVRVGEHIYGHSDGAGWTCQDFKSGEEVWSERGGLGKGAVHFADGMLYCLDEQTGEVVLAEASPKGWNVASRFTLTPLSEQRSRQGKIWTHPVVSGGRLFLRDQEYIYCYDVKK
jgi:outer membrane protein assembly factor BamB